MTGPGSFIPMWGALMDNQELFSVEGHSASSVEWRSLLEAASGTVSLSDEPIQVTRLFGDGSDRLFSRVRQGMSHYVLLISPRAKMDSVDENDSYFLIGRHLFDRGIPVPRILWADPAKGWFLLEDVGDVHFQRLVQRGRISRITLYRHVLTLLLRMHRSIPEGFAPSFCFDAAVYNPDFVVARELHYFRDAFLRGLLERDAATSGLEHDFEDLAESAGVLEPRWVIHRDFQSRNLMVWRGSLRVIDFQGMRYGPPAYDLASLLIDPYVGLSDAEEEALVGVYWDGASKFLGCSRQAFMKSYAAVKLCRNLQALAAYAFLSLVKGKRQFLTYIPSAWIRLRRALSGQLGAHYPALKACVVSLDLAFLRKRLEDLRPVQVFGDKAGRN